jgi:hypothetical protein
MSSKIGGGGFPGGFPSMPGFGDREPPEGDGGSPEGDLLDRLAELTTRHQTGALSDAEYAAEKDRLLTEG